MMSIFTPAMVDPASPCAGTILRGAREGLGWSLFDVAASLRIRAWYLEALEVD